MTTTTWTGRVVGTDGSARANIEITIFERSGLFTDAILGSTVTDASGAWTVLLAIGTGAVARDIFVRAEDPSTQERVDSPLISDLRNSTFRVDLVLGGRYRGPSEFDAIATAIGPWIDKGVSIADIPADRLEWLARRADVFPLHLATFVQAHRLARSRPVAPAIVHALLRAGLPADLPGLLRAGASAWSSALVDAWARSIIPAPKPDDQAAVLADVIEQLDALVLEGLLAVPPAGAVNRRALLDTAALTEDEQREFGRLWHAHEGPLAAFWASVRASAKLGPARADALQFTIAAACLVGHHVPTLAALQAQRDGGEIASARDLAGWDVARWESLLTDAAIDPPATIPDASDLAARRSHFARALVRAVEDAHPSAVIRMRLAADESAGSPPPHTSGVSDFLSDVPEFDLTTTPLARWLAANPNYAIGETTRANVERVARVLRVTPRLGRYATIKVLLEQGIGSAADIVAFTRDEFVRKLGGVLPADDHDPLALAGQIWSLASRMHATTLSLASSFVLAKAGGAPAALAGVGAKLPPAAGGLDDLTTLLGKLDFCACSQCRSVLGPAAYLADLLHFLSARPAAQHANALGVLRARRPDLEHILLDCPNSNTPLPRIDLVIELLERMVAGTLDASSRQTTWTAEQLRLAPEHVELGAYAITSLQAFPWTLPFSLPVAEARGLLGLLGLSRARLLADFGAAPLEVSAAALDMLASEAAIIGGAKALDGRELWGFAPSADAWVESLRDDVPELLRRAGLELGALVELLALTFVDPQHYGAQGLALVLGETCELAKATIPGLDAAALDRLHRFVRLQRRTSIAPRMLSLLIDEIGGGQLDQDFLHRLVAIRAVQARTGLAWDELACLWSTRIDARRYASEPASLYRRRFVAPGSGAPASMQPTSDRGIAIVGEGGVLGPDERAVVLVACRLSEPDLARLLDSPLTDGAALTFANLTKLLRASTLARVAKLEIAELLELQQLSGRDPFASPDETLAWFGELDAIRGAGMTVAGLRWLLHHEGTAILDLDALEAARAIAVRAMAVVDEAERLGLAIEALARELALTPPLAQALAKWLDVAEALVLVGDAAPELDKSRRAWLRLAKAAFVVRQHAIALDELEFFAARLDLAALPVDANDPDASFADWHRLVRALALRSVGQRTIAAAPSFADALALAAEQLAAPLDELAALVDAQGWATVEQLVDESALAKLAALVRAGQAVGVGPATLATWAEPMPSEATSASLRAAAQAWAGERWTSLAQTMRDRLREQQRDALVASVLATHPTITSEALLFDHLLVDTAIAPCMTDTRILQAVAVVQTFVQRVLLQLEPDVRFSSSAISSWAWMKNYRVWEANRRIFLYPENWLEPELRRDASPLFEQLEGTLHADTLDAANVERAMLEYLTGLDRIANLEVLAVHAEHPRAPLHLLARTQAAPRSYFLRSRDTARRWQPWHEVPLAIEGDNVIMLERRGRLLLFWLLAQDEGQTSGDALVTRQRLSIGWSERDDRGWAGTSVSDRSHPLPKLAGERLILRAFNLDDEVRIFVYRQVEALELGVAPLAAFRYDAVSRHVQFGGSEFDPADHPAFLAASGSLHDVGWIGLQGGYRVEGQRFVKVQRDALGNDPPLCAQPAELLASDPRTHFEQGPFAALLFRRASRTGYRSMLHQGDLWTLDAADRFAPVVYDDRVRKYLLEPQVGFVSATIEGDAIDPGMLGALELAAYQDCQPPQAAAPLQISPPKPQLPLVVVQPWALALPGKQALPVELAPNLLAAAQQLVGQDDQVLELAPAFEFPPDAFTLRLAPLHHPRARTMLEQVALHGIDALLRPQPSSPLFRQQDSFEALGKAGLDVDPAIVSGPIPREGFDFDPASPQGLYDWEVFVHAPLRIAALLAADQRWPDALRWLHSIFDPIDTVAGELGPTRNFRVKPLVEQAGALAVDPFEVMLGIGVTPAEQADAIAEFQRQVATWKQNPFDPHAIARVRPGTYARAVLRQYFSTLIAWADHLFAQDTRESIQEATTLYLLVAQLLGPRPRELAGPEQPAKSYAELAAAGLDALSNAAIALESWLVTPLDPAQALGCNGVDDLLPAWSGEHVDLRVWYFCIPPNPDLLRWWEVVEDRLWKIRHCRNLAGVARTLPLLQPPIDPGLLARAVAAGVDLTEALGQLDAPLPRQRFRVLFPRAVALCQELRTLGAALLAALEKRDAEALARLRAEQEVDVLAASRAVRVRQIDEAKAGRRSIELARDAASARAAYFEQLADENMIEAETQQDKHLLRARAFQHIAQSHRALAGFLSLIPQFTLGAPPKADVESGGQQVAGMLHGGAAVFESIAGDFSYFANKAALSAHYARRQADWKFQHEQAALDVARLERELVTADLRIDVLQRELDVHDRQVADAQAVAQLLRDKYTTRELYDWMVRELSSLYFRTYQLALAQARRAEQAHRHELARSDAPSLFIYGHWDNLRRGLLAGDKLAHDLARLELAHQDHDVRELELRRDVSLALHDVDALIDLREQGHCEFELPELLFDLDHPGHYLRRLRSVTLTIPAVVGPNTSIGARLVLLEHATRRTVGDAPLEFEAGGELIATSTALGDGGVFSVDLRDERYLPFEYAGAVSRWRLELPHAVPTFDYRTITDVQLSIAFTAREGGDAFREQVESALPQRFAAHHAQASTLLVVHEAQPNAWAAFLTGEADVAQSIALPRLDPHFAYALRNAGVRVRELELVLMLAETVESCGPVTFTLAAGQQSWPIVLTKPAELALAIGSTGVLAPAIDPGPWTLSRTLGPEPAELVALDGRIDPTRIAGLMLLIHFEIEA